MDKELLLEAKPKYVEVVRFFSINILYAIYGSTTLLAIMVWFFLLTESFRFLVFSTVLYVIAIIFAMGLLLILDKKNYEVTSYKVYPDRVEFEEGFINHKYTTIKMEDIKEIHFVQNFIQRGHGIGTIKFITAANNPQSFTGVAFKDVENPNYIYQKVRQYVGCNDA